MCERHVIPRRIDAMSQELNLEPLDQEGPMLCLCRRVLQGVVFERRDDDGLRRRARGARRAGHDGRGGRRSVSPPVEAKELEGLDARLRRRHAAFQHPHHAGHARPKGGVLVQAAQATRTARAASASSTLPSSLGSTRSRYLPCSCCSNATIGKYSSPKLVQLEGDAAVALLLPDGQSDRSSLPTIATWLSCSPLFFLPCTSSSSTMPKLYTSARSEMAAFLSHSGAR